VGIRGRVTMNPPPRIAIMKVNAPYLTSTIYGKVMRYKLWRNDRLTVKSGSTIHVVDNNGRFSITLVRVLSHSVLRNYSRIYYQAILLRITE
jgi:hypothetical protein